jgi:Zn-finger nucleic acid-binding protein
MSEIICPKCHAAMRTYERNGVHIDQCTDCRGIFLDRGELEHLISAEASWRPAPSAATPTAPQYDERKTSSSKRKRSFFEELFD